MLWEPFLCVVQPFIAFSSLMKDDIYDFVVFAYVFRWYWHQLVDHFAEDRYISPGVASYP